MKKLQVQNEHEKSKKRQESTTQHFLRHNHSGKGSHLGLAKKQSFIQCSSRMHLTESGLFMRPNYAPKLGSQQKFQMSQKLYSMMSEYLPKDIGTIQQSIVNHVEYTLARTRLDFKTSHCYQAVAHSVRDRLIQSFNDTYRSFYNHGKKKVYYFSLEYLLGRCLQNAVININMEEQYKQALRDLGYFWERISEQQVDPALGNGGLGRLAACFLDSLATLNYPSWGYGIRYDYGIFRQQIKDGFQVQIPDYWLGQGNPWQIQRFDVQYKIKFYGKTRKVLDVKGNQKVYWQDYQTIVARAFDTPIPGYATFNTIGLRLWKSLPANQFDFNQFNQGDYQKALRQRQKAEYITSVLYPNDSTDQGKQLRLKQEYLLVSASVQDIIRRDKNAAKINNSKHKWDQFSKMQLFNQTIPIQLQLLYNFSEYQLISNIYSIKQHGKLYLKHFLIQIIQFYHKLYKNGVLKFQVNSYLVIYNQFIQQIIIG